MRTQDLIEALAKEPPPHSAPVAQRFVVICAAGAAAGMAVFFWLLGPRADFMDAVYSPWFLIKLALMATLAALTAPIITALARPGAHPLFALLAVFVALLAAAVVSDIAMLGMDGAAERMVGRNAVDCLTCIPIFSAPPLVAALIALRYGAPTRPGLAGALAGVFSGAIGGLFYGMFCPDDSPLFVLAWYLIAIGMVTAAGFVFGKLTLRW